MMRIGQERLKGVAAMAGLANDTAVQPRRRLRRARADASRCAALRAPCAARKPGSIVSSNTSGIPIHSIAEGRSDAWIARAHGWLDEHDRQRRHRERVREHLDRALALMQADTTRQVRKWLAWLGDPPDEAATVDGPGDTGGPCKPSSASPLPSSPSS